jgi:hypothetical protein
VQERAGEYGHSFCGRAHLREDRAVGLGELLGEAVAVWSCRIVGTRAKQRRVVALSGRCSQDPGHVCQPFADLGHVTVEEGPFSVGERGGFGCRGCVVRGRVGHREDGPINMLCRTFMSLLRRRVANLRLPAAVRGRLHVRGGSGPRLLRSRAPQPRRCSQHRTEFGVKCRNRPSGAHLEDREPMLAEQAKGGLRGRIGVPVAREWRVHRPGPARPLLCASC